MLAVYLAALIAGGLFVVLSLTAGDADSGADADGDVDAGGLHLDADGDADGGFGQLHADLGAEVDGGLELHGVEGGDVGDVGDADGTLGADHHASLADAAHGTDRGRAAPGRRRRWLPFLSFRFWTFGAAFFGLTGTVLTLGGLAGEPATAALSAGMGGAIGTFSSWLVRALRKPVSGALAMGDYQGLTGELLLPLGPGRISKVRVEVRGRQRELLCVSAEEQALPKGVRVVVLEVDGDGRARVAPEGELYLLKESS